MHKSTDSSMISRGPQLRQTTVALELVEQEKTKTDNKTKARQLRKFGGLLNEKSNRRRDDECLDSQKVVRNLSTHSLTKSKRDVLALGLNFGIAPQISSSNGHHRSG